MLGFVRRNLAVKSKEVKTVAYKSLVRPLMEYGSASWDTLTPAQEKELENVQRRAARFTCNIPKTDRTTSTTGLLNNLGWELLSTRRAHRRLNIFAEYAADGKLPPYLVPSEGDNNKYITPHGNTKHDQRSFSICTASDWNKTATKTISATG